MRWAVIGWTLPHGMAHKQAARPRRRGPRSYGCDVSAERPLSDELVIVANRLPVVRADDGTWEVSPGGLVSALAPIVQAGKGSWIGWAGIPGAPPKAFDHGGMRLTPIGLNAREIEGFYEGFANRTLWPLYHDAVRPPEFRREWWQSYVDTNERFAELTARVASPGATVWVHDYQLHLVPALLRALRPDLRIGFFLHIPLPPQELFMQLPWRQQIVEGMLGADLVGFQRPVAAQNFLQICRRLVDVTPARAQIPYQGRTVRVGAFPVSIDFGEIDGIAALPETTRAASELREALGSPAPDPAGRRPARLHQGHRRAPAGLPRAAPERRHDGRRDGARAGRHAEPRARDHVPPAARARRARRGAHQRRVRAPGPPARSTTSTTTCRKKTSALSTRLPM